MKKSRLFYILHSQFYIPFRCHYRNKSSTGLLSLPMGRRRITSSRSSPMRDTTHGGSAGLSVTCSSEKFRRTSISEPMRNRRTLQNTFRRRMRVRHCSAAYASRSGDMCSRSRRFAKMTRHRTAGIPNPSCSDREMDAKRRDITMNALYWNPISRELFDPFSGEKDLKEKLIRIVGEPGIRIKHDALRLPPRGALPCADRRSVPSGYLYRPESACTARRGLSGSRQLEELEKVLKGPHPDRALEDLWELRILERFLPELALCKGIPQPADYHHEGDVWEHMLSDYARIPGRRRDGCENCGAFSRQRQGKNLFAQRTDSFRPSCHSLGRTCGTGAAASSDAKKRIDKIVWLIKHHMMMGSFVETQSGSKPMSDERKAHWYFHPWFLELMALFWLDIAGNWTPPTSDCIIKLFRIIICSSTKIRVRLFNFSQGMKSWISWGWRREKELGRSSSHSMLRKSEGEITSKKKR